MLGSRQVLQNSRSGLIWSDRIGKMVFIFLYFSVDWKRNLCRYPTSVITAQKHASSTCAIKGLQRFPVPWSHPECAPQSSPVPARTRRSWSSCPPRRRWSTSARPVWPVIINIIYFYPEVPRYRMWLKNKQRLKAIMFTLRIGAHTTFWSRNWLSRPVVAIRMSTPCLEWSND